MKKSCPCYSEKPYAECCKPYHDGSPPVNALALMRSRYAAYALHLAGYIIKTTHPDNPAYFSKKAEWKQDILHFSQNTKFTGLTIHEFIDGENEAYVTFTAHLQQGGKDASFTEKSRFLKVQGRWLYRDGTMISGVKKIVST